jgi:sugar phosphate isomerase/epimerase
MELKVFKTLWGHAGSLAQALAAARADDFSGLEGQAPGTAEARRDWRHQLADAGFDYLAEICTAGSYVPERHATPAQHLHSFRRQAAAAVECAPRFLTVIAGCDAWSTDQSVDFFGQAQAAATELGVTASFETHRSRSFFNPWITRDVLLQLPELRLTCDFSHWCVVCERLIDTEPEILELCASRAQHVHARVGYDQGPQVPHPAAALYRGALEAHERWWMQVWQSQLDRGWPITTLTPEFGPDGYLQSHPLTGVPVAELREVNTWMARRQRQRFADFQPGRQTAVALPVLSPP